MTRAGIALDDWKLPVFRKRLTEAGFKYEDGGPLPGDITLLIVETNDLLKLKRVLEECQRECEETKGG